MFRCVRYVSSIRTNPYLHIHVNVHINVHVQLHIHTHTGTDLITLCTSASSHVQNTLRWGDPAMTDVRRTGPPPSDLWAPFHAKSDKSALSDNTHSTHTSLNHISQAPQPAPDYARMTMPQLKTHVQTCQNVLSQAQRGEYLAWATHEANVRATDKAVAGMQVCA